MLLGIDHLLDGDILKVLRDMGHGDELAIVDTNYPASSTARTAVVNRPLKMAGVSAARAIRAVLSVVPLDTFVPHAAWRMEVVGQPDEWPDVQREVQQEIDGALGKSSPMQGVERHDFYRRAAQSYAVLVTGETRGYGCFLLKKGVVTTGWSA
jgi:L-fucose mutarotase